MSDVNNFFIPGSAGRLSLRSKGLAAKPSGQHPPHGAR